MPLSLITDRTIADSTQIKTLRTKINATGWSSLTAGEQALWTAGKGSYNIEDLNRVGNAVSYLAGLINGYGYSVTVNPITAWTTADEFTDADATAYLADIAAIKAAFYGTQTIPAAMASMSVTDANNIELLLLQVEANINHMVSSFRKCGTQKCGTEVVI